MTCAIVDCERDGPLRLGWCAMHYTRWRRTGSPLAVRPSGGAHGKPPRLCSVDGCQERHHGKGFCNRHYKTPPGPRCSKCAHLAVARGMCNRHYRAAMRVRKPRPPRPECTRCGVPNAGPQTKLCALCYHVEYNRTKRGRKPRQFRPTPPPRIAVGEWIDRKDGVTVVHWPKGVSCSTCGTGAVSAEAA